VPFNANRVGSWKSLTGSSLWRDAQKVAKVAQSPPPPEKTIAISVEEDTGYHGSGFLLVSDC
jgi:hypothetical protein